MCTQILVPEIIDPISLKYKIVELEQHYYCTKCSNLVDFCREVRVQYCKICFSRILFDICFLYNTCIILKYSSYCPTNKMLVDSLKTEGITPDVFLTIFARVKLKYFSYTIPKNAYLHYYCILSTITHIIKLITIVMF